MATLARCGRTLVRPFLAKHKLCVSLIPRTSASTWNKDWKPGPFPQTPKERAAAAKKYGLRPEDYEPYPDDGMGYGDYPMLPRVSTESKNPYQVYDTPELKRDYMEPMHVDADAMREDAWNPNMKYYAKNFGTMYIWLFTVVGTLLGGYLLLYDYPFRPCVMPKQYPGDGKKHYTFEPVD